MEGRSVSIIISIIILVLGLIFIVAGIWGLWASFTMPEGGMIRPVAIILLIIGFVVCISYIRKLLRIGKQQSE